MPKVSKEDIRRVAIRCFAGIGRTVGSVVPALKRSTIEVETLSASGSGNPAPAQSAPPPVVMPKELNVRTPSLQPILIPESIFDSKVSDGTSLSEKSKSELRTFAEIPTVHPPAPKVQRKVLPNGVTLIAAGNQSGSTVTIRASIKAADSGAGVAAPVSRLLQRGMSGKRQASLASVFDFLGAEVSNEVDDAISTTIVRGLSKDCGTFLQLLA